MKTPPINIEKWAPWFGIKTFGEAELELLVRGSAQFARAIVDGDTPRWITILGKSGSGKTTCANKLWQFFANFDWQRTLYVAHPIYWPELVKELRNPDSPAHGRILDFKRWPLFFLDDIGAERDATGFATEQLNLILGLRVRKWTILTSNLLLPQLAELDARIASRILREPGNIIISLENTPDYGLRKLS